MKKTISSSLSVVFVIILVSIKKTIGGVKFCGGTQEKIGDGCNQVTSGAVVMEVVVVGVILFPFIAVASYLLIITTLRSSRVHPQSRGRSMTFLPSFARLSSRMTRLNTQDSDHENDVLSEEEKKDSPDETQGQNNTQDKNPEKDATPETKTELGDVIQGPKGFLNRPCATSSSLRKRKSSRVLPSTEPDAYTLHGDHASQADTKKSFDISFMNSNAMEHDEEKGNVDEGKTGIIDSAAQGLRDDEERPSFVSSITSYSEHNDEEKGMAVMNGNSKNVVLSPLSTQLNPHLKLLKNKISSRQSSKSIRSSIQQEDQWALQSLSTMSNSKLT
mmetsp:Transcript_10249/g.13457  ORF Transcript_10249/g.13457 Transcript_10249/m.13457 type:complete len:331 (-) Transcript_10249:24-1016(-)